MRVYARTAVFPNHSPSIGMQGFWTGYPFLMVSIPMKTIIYARNSVRVKNGTLAVSGKSRSAHDAIAVRDSTLQMNTSCPGVHPGSRTRQKLNCPVSCRVCGFQSETLP